VVSVLSRHSADSLSDAPVGVAQRAARLKSRRPLENTPAVVDPGIRLFAELFGEPVVQSARLFTGLVIVAAVAALEGLALWRLVPLKTAVPYLIEASPQGAVARVVEARDYRPTTNMVKAALANWVDQLMVLDAYRTRDNLRSSTILLRGKAVSEHQAFLEAERPFERLLATPDLTRESHVSSVDASSEGLAFVFVTTTERAGTSSPVVRRWRFTIHYMIAAPQDEVEILANPVGINISHFERAADNA
jgi:type IV secretory pathway component VirB8